MLQCFDEIIFLGYEPSQFMLAVIYFWIRNVDVQFIKYEQKAHSHEQVLLAGTE